ncbi:MAG TPA: helix-turn-helix transcriptional regulator, partial [Dehalococcoidia bacterium]|nr:helix-turn-helix transcriptional regulator [Dehalococcoidia bacterium]
MTRPRPPAGRRGRPPHPDILTPREWEVLALLREGLSDQAIADRLGISLDGAKYHVREILSKLSVTSRQEAAAWQPEERAPA